jgi:hypothetical protein
MSDNVDVNAFFNGLENNYCKEFCGLRGRLEIVGVGLKESLIARGKLPSIIHSEVVGNDIFMELLLDLVRIHFVDYNETFGTIVHLGVTYNIVTEFELSDKKVKPKYYQKLCGDRNIPTAVFNQLVKNREKLLRKITATRDSLIDFMDLVKPVVVTPTRTPETRAQVQSRIDAFMVIILY